MNETKYSKRNSFKSCVLPEQQKDDLYRYIPMSPCTKQKANTIGVSHQTVKQQRQVFNKSILQEWNKWRLRNPTSPKVREVLQRYPKKIPSHKSNISENIFDMDQEVSQNNIRVINSSTLNKLGDHNLVTKFEARGQKPISPSYKKYKNINLVDVKEDLDSSDNDVITNKLVKSRARRVQNITNELADSKQTNRNFDKEGIEDLNETYVNKKSAINHLKSCVRKEKSAFSCSDKYKRHSISSKIRSRNMQKIQNSILKNALSFKTPEVREYHIPDKKTTSANVTKIGKESSAYCIPLIKQKIKEISNSRTKMEKKIQKLFPTDKGLLLNTDLSGRNLVNNLLSTYDATSSVELFIKNNLKL